MHTSLLEKPFLTRWTFVGKIMSLLFNMLSRFVIVFLPRRKCLLISWLQVTMYWFWSPRKWSLSLFPLFPHLFAMKWWDRMPWPSFYECWVLSQLFHSPLSLSSRGSLVPLHFCHKGGVICISEVIDISECKFTPQPKYMTSCFVLFCFPICPLRQGKQEQTTLDYTKVKSSCIIEEAIVRTGHGTTDWFQIRKGVRQGCILSPCLFNLYAEYIMRNAGLKEAQAGIKIAGRNIHNLRYADDTTLMAEVKRN